MTRLPRDLILRPGFVFNQEFTAPNGVVYRAGSTLRWEIIIPSGTSFAYDFKLPAGSSLSNTYTPGEEESDDLLYIKSDFWSQSGG